MYHCTMLELSKFFPSEILGSKPEQTKPFQPMPQHLPFWGWRAINSRESHFFPDRKTKDQKGVVTFARLPLELGLNYRITQNIAVYIGMAALSLWVIGASSKGIQNFRASPFCFKEPASFGTHCFYFLLQSDLSITKALDIPRTFSVQGKT